MWLAGLMNPQPITMNRSTIATLVMTMRPLTNADSVMPRISSRRQHQHDEQRGHVHDPVRHHRRVRVVPLSNGEWHQA